MKKQEKSMYTIIALVIMGCIAMAFIEVVVEPPYTAKSVIKIILFFIIPSLSLAVLGEKGIRAFMFPDRDGLLKSLLLGSIVYFLIMGAFGMTRGIFDYSGIVAALSTDQRVGKESFFWVAGYISFCNSLLEEFFFRGLAFLKLCEIVPRRRAYLFSALAFALYHVAMIANSFPLPLLLIVLAGLVVGGLLFDFLDERNRTIYNSWMVHMFADLALMTIWFLTL